MANMVLKDDISPESGILNFLTGVYDKVTGNLPIVGSAEDLANEYLKSGKSPHDAVDSLIKWQCTKTASVGFLTGLGGLLTMPVTLPADMVQSWYIQLRMTAAIAHIYAHDIYSDQLKTFCILCLCGKGAQNIIKEVGKKTGEGIVKKAIKSIPGHVLSSINKAVGCKLVTKAGKTSIVNLTKIVPVIGGVIGGTFNAIGTLAVGKAAKRCFKDGYEDRIKK